MAALTLADRPQESGIGLFIVIATKAGFPTLLSDFCLGSTSLC